MFNPARLLALLTTKGGAGVTIATLAAGGTGATVIVSHVTGHSTVLVSTSSATTTTTTATSTTTTASSQTTTASGATSTSSASTSTGNHGDAVTAAVAQCKAEIRGTSSTTTAAGTTTSTATGHNPHGIGWCVSQVANGKGQTQSGAGHGNGGGHPGH
jgi:hypothetical protein